MIWNVQERFRMYRHAWGCLGMLRNVQECLQMPRHAQECLGMFWNAWACLEVLREVLRNVGMFRSVQDVWERLGMLRNVWECFDRAFRNVEECLGAFRHVYERLGMLRNIWQCVGMSRFLMSGWGRAGIIIYSQVKRLDLSFTSANYTYRGQR